ncbi:hypothetical protein KUTeg_023044 [Tegillarca granosa]|uniref:guanylate cyclase n=1 Tax=Tegillarca granosa TaxID=220873 RepID=A0ABQ9E0H5_TEGGR|nr:hypothetical protein KUTeg_023044 [Tegillarca granosa]
MIWNFQGFFSRCKILGLLSWKKWKINPLKSRPICESRATYKRYIAFPLLRQVDPEDNMEIASLDTNYYFEEENHHLIMKGQMIYITDWDKIVFLGTPVLENLDSMFISGMYINDLSMHDSSRDLVLAGTQQSSELRLALDQVSTQQSSELRLALDQVSTQQSSELRLPLDQVSNQQSSELRLPLDQVSNQQSSELRLPLDQVSNQQSSELRLPLDQVSNQQSSELRLPLDQVSTQQSSELRLPLDQVSNQQSSELRLPLDQCSFTSNIIILLPFKKFMKFGNKEYFGHLVLTFLQNTILFMAIA